MPLQKEGERRNPALSHKVALARAGQLSSWQSEPRMQEGAVSEVGEKLRECFWKQVKA